MGVMMKVLLGGVWTSTVSRVLIVSLNELRQLVNVKTAAFMQK